MEHINVPSNSKRDFEAVFKDLETGDYSGSFQRPLNAMIDFFITGRINPAKGTSGRQATWNKRFQLGIAKI